MLQNIVGLLTANALILVALTYLFEKLIAHRLEKDLSNFKREADKEIESFKAQLEQERLRLQISYGGIFEKQAVAVLDLYRGLIDLELAAGCVINNIPSADESSKQFHAACVDVRSHYRKNRILLPIEIDEAACKLIDDMFWNASTFAKVETRLSQYQTEEQFKAAFAKQDQALEVLNQQLPPLRELLVLSMRKTLGIQRDQGTKT